MRLLCFAALLMSASTGMAARPKIAVLDVSTTGIEASLVPMLTEVLTVEVDALERFQVVAGSDVRALLGFEKQKDLFGCNDASCFAEIGGALGVEKLVVANIGRLGNTYIVNIKLIDIKKVETQGRVYETVQGEVDLLLQTIRASVRRVFANVPEVKGDATASVAEPQAAPPVVAQVQPPAVRDATPVVPPPAATGTVAGQRSWTLPIVLWGVGAAALGAGAYFGSDAKSNYEAASDATKIGAQVHIAPGERSQLIANVAFGVSAVAIVSGFGFWWLGRPRAATLAVAPTSGGAAVVSSFALDL